MYHYSIDKSKRVRNLVKNLETLLNDLSLSQLEGRMVFNGVQISPDIGIVIHVYQ